MDQSIIEKEAIDIEKELIVIEEDVMDEIDKKVNEAQVKPKKAEKLLNSMYVRMLVVALFINICNNMLNTSLPLYVQTLGADKAVAGLVMGVLTISALVCRPIFGPMVDIIGRKFTLMVGSVIMILSCLGFGLMPIVMAILVLRGFQGIGLSAYSTAGGTVVADVLPASRLAEGVGYYGISANIATAVGPSLALILIGAIGYNNLFFLSAFMCALGLLLILTFTYEKKAKQEAMASPDYVKPEKVKFNIKTAFEKSAIPASASQFFLIMTMGFNMTFIATFGITEKIDNVGMYYTVMALVILGSRFFVGRLSDKIGYNKIIIPGIFMVIIGTFILPFTKSLTPLIISAAILGLGYGCINPTLNAFIMKICPKERRGAANATYYAAFDGGVGFGSMIGGTLVQTMGFQYTYFCLVGITVVGLLIYIKYPRKQISEMERAEKAAL